MPIGILFWALMILWLIFGGLTRANPQWAWGIYGHGLFIWFMFFLIGWNDFGFILQGGRHAPF
jgi:hypothetical protein